MNDTRFLHAMSSAWRTAVWVLAGAGLLSALLANAADEPSIMFGRHQRLPAKLLTDEVAVVPDDASTTAATTSVRAMGLSSSPAVAPTQRYSVVKLGGQVSTSDTTAARALQDKARAVGSEVAPVLLLADGESRIVCTGRLVASFPAALTDAQVQALETKYGLTRVETIDLVPNTYIYTVPDTMAVVALSNVMTESDDVEFAYPEYFNGGMAESAFKVNDPLFGREWHLKNTGQSGGEYGADANIGNIWNLYRGSVNQVVAVVDDRVQTSHEDLIGTVSAQFTKDFTGVGSASTGGHGTSVAGVIGAYGGNLKGVIGVVPRGLMVGYQVFASGIWLVTAEEEADALSYRSYYIDIYSNSWGYTGGAYGPLPLPPLTEAAMKKGVTDGRQGLGNIYVFAGGNYAQIGDNTNYSGYTNSQYTICVAATNNFAQHSYYSNPGCNILVNAPSDGGSAGIVTTDLMGNAGYNSSDSPDGNYTTDFGGTSSATPVVSGVIALMLQANPSLTWQDVQHILLTTATRNAPTDGSWELQGANAATARFPYSHYFGFGRVDAEKAVKTAATFLTTGPRTRKVVELSQAGALFNTPDTVEGLGSRYQMDFQNMSNLFIEHIDVTIDTTGVTAGTVITLEGPWGTRSVLADGLDSDVSYYTFSTIRHYGEGIKIGEFEDFSGDGTWFLYFGDSSGNPSSATLNYLKISFYGRPDTDNGGFGDGLPDDWEVAFFGNNIDLDSITPDGDNNGDGKTNWQHFLDGTDPAGRSLVVYSLSDSISLQGTGVRQRTTRYGILVNNYSTNDLVSVVSMRDRGGMYYFEEHWGQVTENGIPSVLKYKADAATSQHEIIATVDYADGTPDDGVVDSFTSRTLIGRNVADASSMGLTRISVANTLNGKYRMANTAAGLAGDGWISLRLDKIRTREASRSNVTTQRIIDDYKKDLDKRNQVERMLILDVSASALSENGGTITGTVTRASRTQDQDPQEGVSVNLSDPLTVTLTSHDQSELTMPLTVTIPAGQVSQSFTISGVDDADQDGNQLVKIRATTYGYTPAVRTLTVVDDD